MKVKGEVKFRHLVSSNEYEGKEDVENNQSQTYPIQQAAVKRVGTFLTSFFLKIHPNTEN